MLVHNQNKKKGDRHLRYPRLKIRSIRSIKKRPYHILTAIREIPEYLPETREIAMENIQVKPPRPATIFIFLLVFAMTCLILSNSAMAGDDQSIKGQLRTDITNSMVEYIKKQTIDGKLYVFDAVQNKLLVLTSGVLHKRITRDGGFYITCADYIDQDGQKVDLDFFVKTSGNKQITTQTIVHAIADQYRPYHVSDRNN